jgi:hypothetical protein
MREAILRGDARRVFDSLTPEERDEVLAIMRRLEADASIDNRTTFELPRPPLILRMFHNGIWQVVYQVADEATVAIFGIRRVWPP